MLERQANAENLEEDDATFSYNQCRLLRYLCKILINGNNG